MMKTLIIVVLLLAAQAFADTQQDCQQIMTAMGDVEITAKQAKLVDQLQAAVGQICQRTISAEQAKIQVDAKVEELNKNLTEACIAGSASAICKGLAEDKVSASKQK